MKFAKLIGKPLIHKQTVYYVQKSYRNEDGKPSTKYVERLGTLEDLEKRFWGEDPVGEAKKYLAKKVNRAGEKFSPDQILGTLQDMNFLKVTGEGCIPTYTRTDLTNHLHGSAGFRTDTQIVTKKTMKSIIASIKTSKDETDNDEV